MPQNVIYSNLSVSFPKVSVYATDNECLRHCESGNPDCFAVRKSEPRVINSRGISMEDTISPAMIKCQPNLDKEKSYPTLQRR